MSIDDQGSFEGFGPDEGSPHRLAGCRVRVLDIARYHERWKWTPEQIVQELRVLTMADVYAALSHYHSHQDEMDAQMAAEDDRASELEDQVSLPLKLRLAEIDARVIRYHLDRSCPNSLAEVLRERGIDVTTTPEVWLTNASDGEQLSYAESSRRIILTRDMEFLGLSPDCDRSHHGVFFLNLRPTLHDVAKTLIQIQKYCDANEFVNRVEYL